MHFRLPPNIEAWRRQLREFLHTAIPAGFEGDDDFFDREEDIGFAREFGRKLGERGWFAPGWPKEYGGIGAGPLAQLVLNEELAYHRAPPSDRLLTIGIAGSAILVHGSAEQRTEFLPPMANGEHWYCQGFSEPDSGSDLASMKTTAIRDGDDWVVNGTKIWTTNAHAADRMLLLARTGEDQAKHRSISAFVVDMNSPGISVAPVLNIGGRRDFNQVTFDDVRVPAEHMIGGLNQGWRVATTTLDFERSNIAAISGARRTVDDLIGVLRNRACAPTDAEATAIRSQATELAVECEIGRLLCYRVACLQEQGQIPNHEASVAKVFMATLGIKAANVTIAGLGLAGQLMPVDERSPLRGRTAMSHLLAVSGPIGGGTGEIQRNIIAQRGLGLPRA